MAINEQDINLVKAEPMYILASPKSLFPRLVRSGLRVTMAFYHIFLKLSKISRRSKGSILPQGYKILLTGTFYSKNWIVSHLQPLALSSLCKSVFMVTETPLPPIDKVKAIYPPLWLVNILGGDLARLVTFAWYSISLRPQIVGGFHLLVNGLVALLIGKILGSFTLYICGGGPREVLGGGYLTENRLFGKLDGPDSVLERYLLKAVSEFDIVVTRGKKAIEFFKNRGVASHKIHFIPGSKDGRRFFPSNREPTIDLILVGRLSSVKRVDIFLEAIKIAKSDIPGITAVVLGDGPERSFLERMAKDLGLKKNVNFVGHQKHVEKWLKKAKIFVLTSDSEGLSQAMIEAMLCGLPVIVSNVGDLSEMVEDEVNGHLVNERTPQGFAACIIELLNRPKQLIDFGRAARNSAEKCDIVRVSRLWDEILKNL